LREVKAPIVPIIIIILLQLDVYPVAVDLTLRSRPYTDTYKEIRLYIEGRIQNKLLTVQIQTHIVTRSAHVTRTHTHTPSNPNNNFAHM
jgi:hypothetical protein